MELDAAERSSPPGSPDVSNWERRSSPPGSPGRLPTLDTSSIGSRESFRATRTRRAINQLDGMCRDAPMWRPP